MRKWKKKNFRPIVLAARGFLVLIPPLPAIIWTAGHGMAFDATDAEQMQLQGALLTGDWPGFDTIERQHYLAAADLGDDADLRGLVAFLFACYGAGTPRIDSYPSRSGAA